MTTSANPTTSGQQRFADPQTASRYPLACGTGLSWRAANDNVVCRVHIEHIPEASILIPSLSVVGVADYAFDIDLLHGTGRWSLATVPNLNAADNATAKDNSSPVSTHIDCFHIHQALTDLTLEFRLRCGGIPERYLLTASWRPLQIDHPDGPLTSVCCTPPPAISQMSQGGPAGPAICSPACIAMVLRGYDASVDLLQVAKDCQDPATKMYGIWPNAIRSAARNGFIGATEAVAHWADAERVLELGYPLVASIRFADGALPGAPLNATGGHLVLIHGASPECVVVNDPAAPEVATVPRTYDATRFTQAWLRYRGAAYILLP